MILFLLYYLYYYYLNIQTEKKQFYVFILTFFMERSPHLNLIRCAFDAVHRRRRQLPMVALLQSLMQLLMQVKLFLFSSICFLCADVFFFFFFFFFFFACLFV